MLIESSCRLKGEVLPIPRSNCAPLNLSETGRIFMLVVPVKAKHVIELVISTFSPETWADLWHIELDLHDKPGLLSRLFSLLSKERVRVLAAETTSLESDQYHTMSLIVDCRQYHSSTDRTWKERIEQPRATLRDLYEVIAVTFVEELVFSDRESPKLSLKRLDSYHRCYRHLSSKSLARPYAARIDGRKLRLPPSIGGSPLASLYTKPLDLTATILTDSTERIMRVFFIDRNKGILNIRIAFRNEPTAVVNIVSAISNANFNVLRSQLRQGTPTALMRTLESHEEYGTLDLVVRTLARKPGNDETLLRSIQKTLGKVEDLAPYDIHVISAYSEPQP